MKNFFISLAILAVFTPINLFAVDKIDLGQVVVTATRTEKALESVASSVTVIRAEEIEKRQAVTVLEVLRGIKGLDVVQRGSLGKKASVYIRGGNAGHTLVMIDGTQINSPTSGDYDFANLTVDNIERIEILRGQQSTLYGSDAMGGVINIITKKGQGPPKFILSVEGGSFDTYRESLSVSGSMDKTDYSLAISRVDTDGISAASDKNGNTEKDGYNNSTFAGRLAYYVNEAVDVDLTFRYTDAENAMDACCPSDDTDYTQEYDSLLITTTFNYLVNDQWNQALKLSLVDEELKSEDLTNASLNSDIKTKVSTADWQHNLYFLGETNTLTVGFEYEKQEGENASASFDRSLDNRAFYLQEQFVLLEGNMNLTAGIRNDDHSKFGSETSYRAAVSYLLNPTDTKVKASWGKAYKAPTINDLYFNLGWAVGNENLKLETSRGYEFGVEQSLLDKNISLSATYFHNDFDNLIAWDWSVFPMTVDNITEVEVKGWEFDLEAKLPNNLHMQAAYTIADSEDKANGNELSRRPKHKGSLSIVWSQDKLDMSLTVNYVGARWDNSSNTDRLDSYKKGDLAISYDLTENVKAFGRVDNLSNREYEEAKGYGTAGRSYYAGLKASF